MAGILYTHNPKDKHTHIYSYIDTHNIPPECIKAKHVIPTVNVHVMLRYSRRPY